MPTFLTHIIAGIDGVIDPPQCFANHFSGLLGKGVSESEIILAGELFKRQMAEKRKRSAEAQPKAEAEAYHGYGGYGRGYGGYRGGYHGGYGGYRGGYGRYRGKREAEAKPEAEGENYPPIPYVSDEEMEAVLTSVRVSNCYRRCAAQFEATGSPGSNGLFVKNCYKTCS